MKGMSIVRFLLTQPSDQMFQIWTDTKTATKKQVIKGTVTLFFLYCPFMLQIIIKKTVNKKNHKTIHKKTHPKNPSPPPSLPSLFQTQQ